MGWSSGTEHMVEIAEAYESLHADENEEVKIAFYQKIVDAMTNKDWDNLDEVAGISDELDTVLREEGVDFDEPF